MKKLLIFTLLVPSLFLSACGKKDQKNPGNSEDIPAEPSDSDQGRGEQQHTHNWSSSWSNDETNHWHSCSGCTEKGELAAHTFGAWQVISEAKEERACSVCGFKEEKNHEHTYSTAWAYNELTHWHASTCGHNLKGSESSHTFNGENICTVCGYQQPAQQGISVLDSFPRTSAYVKYHGRNYHYKDKVEMNCIGSGFEVRFHGTELSATLDADFGSWYGKTRVSVFVDGEKDPTLRPLCLEYGSRAYNYQIVSDLTEGDHTVKVLKRSEDLATRMSLYRLSTDGYFLEKVEDHKLKIEVFGDSITCGYGNLRGSLLDTTSSAYQDGLETYATYAAFELGADINVFSRTGSGLYTCQGYTTGSNSLLKDTYNKTDYQGTHDWDMSYYTPDIVIINKGTNDYWWQTSSSGQDVWGNNYNGNFNDSTFKNEYVSLVKKLVEAYGNNTAFILTSGFMETNVYSRILSIKNQLVGEIQNPVFTHEFAQCAEGHPKAHEHKVGGEEIVELIRQNGLDTPVNNQKTITKAFDEEYSCNFSISPRSNKAAIVQVTEDSLKIHNENWMAGFVLDNTNRGNEFNVTMNVGAETTSIYPTRVIYGFMHYFVDGYNFIIVYLQFSSTGVMRNIGCTGFIDGKDLGWLDFFNINDVAITDWTDFGELSINREYNKITVKYGGKVQSKLIPGMTQPSYRTGYYCFSEVDATFSNIVYGDVKELTPDPLPPSPAIFPTDTYEYVGSGTMEMDGDNVVMHNGTWKDAFALRTLDLGGSYTLSTTITANKDAFATSDDAMLGIVINYVSSSEFCMMLLSYGDFAGRIDGCLRCITIDEVYDGLDHWVDFWDFQNHATHLTTGEDMTVVKNGSSLTVSFVGLTVTKTLSYFGNVSARYAGFYSQKTTNTTFSNIVWTSTDL